MIILVNINNKNNNKNGCEQVGMGMSDIYFNEWEGVDKSRREWGMNEKEWSENIYPRKNSS